MRLFSCYLLIITFSICLKSSIPKHIGSVKIGRCIVSILNSPQFVWMFPSNVLSLLLKISDIMLLYKGRPVRGFLRAVLWRVCSFFYHLLLSPHGYTNDECFGLPLFYRTHIQIASFSPRDCVFYFWLPTPISPILTAFLIILSMIPIHLTSTKPWTGCLYL